MDRSLICVPAPVGQQEIISLKIPVLWRIVHPQALRLRHVQYTSGRDQRTAQLRSPECLDRWSAKAQSSRQLEDRSAHGLVPEPDLTSVVTA